VLRSVILAASRHKGIERAVTRAPVTRGVVRRFVGGPDTAGGVQAARTLLEQGLTVTLDHLGEDTTDAEQAAAVADAYVQLLTQLQRAGVQERLGPLTARCDVSVKLSAVGQALPGDGEKIALENARRICEQARQVGATVTLDMEDHTTTDSTLAILHDLRLDYPDTGAVLQSYLRRTLADCRDLSGQGSRVRLCKGAYREPASVAYQKREDVDLSYVRCVNVLLAGQGYPMFATHDPRMIAIATERAAFHGKGPGEHEFQMLYGIRPDEQLRLSRDGATVRVYVPYGAEWYGYLMRRLAERPANLTFFARALLSKR
jgi:proline dehydrogenase